MPALRFSHNKFNMNSNRLIMIKKIPAFLILFLMFAELSAAQIIPPLSMNPKDKSSTLAAESFGEVALALFPLNPILMIEGDKFYAGLTKEVSFGYFPYGRVAAEYSLIFRETRVNHLRFSYNYDIVLEAGDFAAFFLTLGGGYFTDFKKEGYFPQLSLSMLIAFTDNLGTNPYIKLRHTFMNDSKKSDISDLSLGLSLYVSF